jgi:N-methylhydantoinase A
VSRTVLIDSDDPEVDARLADILAELEVGARESMIAEGADPLALSAERRVDARYRGQSFELAVPADGWTDRFHRSHLERYGYERRATPVEAVTLRVVVTAPAVEPEVGALDRAERPPETHPTTVVHGGRALEGARVWRRDLRAGHELAGPLIVQEYSATTWVPPEWMLTVDASGSLHLTRAEGDRPSGISGS